MCARNTSYRRAIATLAGFALSLIAQHAAVRAAEKGVEKAAADAKDTKAKYLRIVRDAKDRVVGLETAIVTFRPAAAQPDEVQVDLVAAVHVADKRYYQDLNKRFAGYDVVLYELVAPKGTRIPKGGRKDKSGNVVSSLQMGMKNMLELEYQLDQVDYTRKNFVHADLSPDEFFKSMHDRNEGFADIVARLIAMGIAKQTSGKSDGDVNLLLALFDSNRALALKRAVAEQFEDSEGAMAILDGPKGSTLIGERNKRALEVLKKQLAAGKKKIAIFYGGGHMPDMEKRLRADFALQAEKTEWLRAWDMK